MNFLSTIGIPVPFKTFDEVVHPTDQEKNRVASNSYCIINQKPEVEEDAAWFEYRRNSGAGNSYCVITLPLVLSSVVIVRVQNGHVIATPRAQGKHTDYMLLYVSANHDSSKQAVTDLDRQS